MKKLLFFAFVSVSFFAKSQTTVYHPFPDSSTTWNFHHSLPFCIGGTIDENYSITISGDTLISAQTYHKLTTPCVQSFSSGTCGFGMAAGYKGAIRQDVNLKKVFYVPPTELTEQLLFDFNMAVGDTIKGFTTTLFFQNDTVASIDSVLVGSDYRKRWNINSSYNIYFIEGIGSTYGLFEKSPGSTLDQADYSLTCFKQNEITLFPDSTTNCDLIMNYQSIFGNDSTTWNVVHVIIDGASTDIFKTKTNFDSTMNGLNYKIVFVDFFGNPQSSGLIREDTTTGKVWYYSFNTQMERTIMDLSLQQNDTFMIYTYWNDSLPAVVDTIFYLNGLKHVQFDQQIFSDQGQTKLEFIESIGANAGITFHENIYTALGDQLLCKYNDTTLVYSNTGFNGYCIVELSGIVELPFDNVIVFPNPVSRNNLLHLKNDGDVIQSVTLFDLLGNQISRTNKDQLKIEQAPGIYVIEIVSKSGAIKNSKLVVTD